jgi:hypothetical protein
MTTEIVPFIDGNMIRYIENQINASEDIETQIFSIFKTEKINATVCFNSGLVNMLDKSNVSDKCIISLNEINIDVHSKIDELKTADLTLIIAEEQYAETLLKGQDTNSKIENIQNNIKKMNNKLNETKSRPEIVDNNDENIQSFLMLDAKQKSQFEREQRTREENMRKMAEQKKAEIFKVHENNVKNFFAQRRQLKKTLLNERAKKEGIAISTITKEKILKISKTQVKNLSDKFKIEFIGYLESTKGEILGEYFDSSQFHTEEEDEILWDLVNLFDDLLTIAKDNINDCCVEDIFKKFFAKKLALNYLNKYPQLIDAVKT